MKNRPSSPADSAPPRRGALYFDRFAQSSDDVFWLADLATRRLLYVSPRFEHYWGVSADALMADPELWNRAVLPEDAARLPTPFFADDGADDGVVREYRIRTGDGALRWIRERRFHWRDRRGGGARVGGIAEDVTEHKRREFERDELLERERRARAEAETVAAAKDEFLAVVTHELRSPLNAIRGWAHVLRLSGELSDAQTKALDAIDRNTQAQSHLVDDLLDSQRILCGELGLDIGRASLATLINEAVDAIRPMAQTKRIRLEVSHDPRIDIVTVDVDRLRQAMVKLLSNAIKFTPDDGLVQVGSLRRGDSIAIEVKDSGIGIDPAQLKQVFERFRQADSSCTRRQPGLGLGLSLAQQLVELHGGRIQAHSEGIGHGASFSIELPGQPEQAVAASPDTHRRSQAQLAGKRIVVVEDDADGREVLALILREAKAELHSFERAADAYDFLRAAPPDQQPDALISDIAMPDEDGYAFIRRVREMEGSLLRPRRLVALAVTSFARVEDKARALRAGFDFHLAKPIDSQTVIDTLASALGMASRRARDESPPRIVPA